MAKDIRHERKPGKLIRHAERNDCRIRYSKGSHVMVEKDGVTTCIPNHGELKTGTHRAIIKAFAAMGIVLFLGICYLLFCAPEIIPFIQ